MNLKRSLAGAHLCVLEISFARLPSYCSLPLSLFSPAAWDLLGFYRTIQSSRGKPEMQPLSGTILPAVWAWPMMQCRGLKETPFFSLSRSILILSLCSTFFNITVITLVSSILKPSKLPTYTAFLRHFKAIAKGRHRVPTYLVKKMIFSNHNKWNFCKWNIFNYMKTCSHTTIEIYTSFSFPMTENHYLKIPWYFQNDAVY